MCGLRAAGWPAPLFEAVVSAKYASLSPRDLDELFGDRAADPALLDGPAAALEFLGDRAIVEAVRIAGSLRSSHGHISTSESVPEADRHAEYLFAIRSPVRCTPSFSNTTLALIKPHALRDGIAGQIIDAILQNGFRITAMQSFALEKKGAEEFLEVYKGVVPDYSAMVAELISGKSIALEIAGAGDVHTRFRDLCGPIDAGIAKRIRPKTLRARFGLDRVQNAVHCTDLPEDTENEVDFFFG